MKLTPTAKEAKPSSPAQNEDDHTQDDTRIPAADMPDGVLPHRVFEEPFSVPPYIDDKTIAYFEKRYGNVSVPRGNERSALVVLDDDSAEQQLVKTTGESPLEFLTNVYRTPLVRVSDRIKAASVLMPYMHDERPKRIGGIAGAPGLLGETPLLVGLGQFDPKRLTTKELDTFEALLRKACTPEEEAS